MKKLLPLLVALVTAVLTVVAISTYQKTLPSPRRPPDLRALIAAAEMRSRRIAKDDPRRTAVEEQIRASFRGARITRILADVERPVEVVVVARDAPVPGLPVSIAFTSPTGRLRLRSAVTNQEGRIDLRGTSGLYRFEVTPGGRSTHYGSVEKKMSVEHERLTVRLAVRRTLAFSSRLVLPDGTPLAGARAILSGPDLTTIESQSDGSGVLLARRLRDQPYTLTIRTERYRDHTIQVRPGLLRLRIVVPALARPRPRPLVAVRVQVSVVEGGRRVRADRRRFSFIEGNLDGEGGFDLVERGGARPGFTLVKGSDRYHVAAVEGLPVRAGSPIEVVLRWTPRLSIRVLSGASTGLVTGARVFGRDRAQAWVPFIESGPGVFRGPRVAPPRRVWTSVNAPGHVPVLVRLAARVTPHEIRLAPAFVLRGRVACAGNPVAGAAIRLAGPRPARLAADGQGMFEIREVPAGTYLLTATPSFAAILASRASPRHATWIRREVVVSSDLVLDLDLPPGRQLHGRVEVRGAAEAIRAYLATPGEQLSGPRHLLFRQVAGKRDFPATVARLTRHLTFAASLQDGTYRVTMHLQYGSYPLASALKIDSGTARILLRSPRLIVPRLK